MEKLVYEIRPFFFMGGGLSASLSHISDLMLASGILLIAASAYVLWCRAKYRVWLST